MSAVNKLHPYNGIIHVVVYVVPSDSIRNLTVTSPIESNTTLIVSWIPPNEPNGVIISYELDISTSTLYHSVYNVSIDIQEDRVSTNTTDHLG